MSSKTFNRKHSALTIRLTIGLSFLSVITLIYITSFNYFSLDGIRHLLRKIPTYKLSIVVSRDKDKLLPLNNVSQETVTKIKSLLSSNVMKQIENLENHSKENNSVLKANYTEYFKQFQKMHNTIILVKYVQYRKNTEVSYPLKKKKSCALVSSAGGLLGRNLGEFIDRHDAIFRFNDAIFENYERHVGSRTDFRIMANSVMAHILGGFWEDIYKNESIIMYDCCNSIKPPGECIQTSDAHQMFARQSYERTNVSLYSLDCQVVKDANRLLLNMTDLPVPIFSISTGFVGFLVSYKMCDIIDLFGFIEQDANKSHYHRRDSDDTYINPMGLNFHNWLLEKSMYLGLNTLDDNQTFGNGIIRVITNMSDFGVENN